MDGVEATKRAAAGGPGPALPRAANAGDVDGVVDLYEPGAVLAFSPGRLAAGRSAIREVYADLLASRPLLAREIRPAIRNGDIAITSTVRAGTPRWRSPAASRTAPGCG